jgi:hypothetical protein
MSTPGAFLTVHQPDITSATASRFDYPDKPPIVMVDLGYAGRVTISDAGIARNLARAFTKAADHLDAIAAEALGGAQ